MVLEVHQEYPLSCAVLGHLEQIDHACEARSAGEGGGDILPSDLANARHLHFTAPELVAAADLDPRPMPDPDTASDFAGNDRIVQALGEGHSGSPVFLVAEPARLHPAERN